jgi:hypothetical protein
VEIFHREWLSSPIFAPIEAQAAATVRGLALSLRLLIPCLACAIMFFVLRVSRFAHDGCLRIDRSRQCRKQLGPCGLQFSAMRLSESPEQRFSAAREGQYDFAAVCHTTRAL